MRGGVNLRQPLHSPPFQRDTADDNRLRMLRIGRLRKPCQVSFAGKKIIPELQTWG